MPEPGTRSDALTCPAWLTTDHEAKTYLCYYSTGELGDGEATGQFPFGRCSSNAQSIVPTMLISQLPDPAATLALREFDRRQMPEDSDSFYATDPRVPQHPVHGETRNALYFDGHVSAIP